jgi:hypothetical protein
MAALPEALFVPTPPVLDSTIHCSLCGGPLMVYTTARGIKVRCENRCAPTCHENVEGFGSTIKAAYEIACQKYKKS